MLDASEVLLKVADFLCFCLTSSSRFFEGCVFFGLLLSQQLLQYPANILITCCCLLCRSCYWCRLMGSVG
jgi:hypothetical protein